MCMHVSLRGVSGLERFVREVERHLIEAERHLIERCFD
jgi:hypothetical protein